MIVHNFLTMSCPSFIIPFFLFSIFINNLTLQLYHIWPNFFIWFLLSCCQFDSSPSFTYFSLIYVFNFSNYCDGWLVNATFFFKKKILLSGSIFWMVSIAYAKISFVFCFFFLVNILCLSFEQFPLHTLTYPLFFFCVCETCLSTDISTDGIWCYIVLWVVPHSSSLIIRWSNLKDRLLSICPPCSTPFIFSQSSNCTAPTPVYLLKFFCLDRKGLLHGNSSFL